MAGRVTARPLVAKLRVQGEQRPPPCLAANERRDRETIPTRVGWCMLRLVTRYRRGRHRRPLGPYNASRTIPGRSRVAMLQSNLRSAAPARLSRGCHNSAFRAIGAAVALLAAGSSARAEPVESKRAAQKMNLRVPPPPEPVDRSFRTHDGPSIRLGVGPGWFSATNRQDAGPVASEDLSTRGWDANLDVNLGYAPTPGLTVGLAGNASFQLTGEWETDGVALAAGDLATLFVGPFVDGYLRPQGGWHFGGSVGLAQLRFDVDERSNATGFGANLWAGRDFWVAPDWSLGSALRTGFLRGRHDASDASATRFNFALILQATYQ